MAVTYTRAWAGLALRSGPGVHTGPYSSLQFSVNSNGNGLPDIDVSMYGSGGMLKQVSTQSYARSASGGWYNVSIPLSALNAVDRQIYRVQLQEGEGRPQSTINIDRLVFSGESTSTSGGSTGGTSTPTTSYKVCTGGFKPSQASTAVNNVIRQAAAKYNMPRWFYYTIAQRESSFDPYADNGRDKGLFQIVGDYYTGKPYPNWLSTPNDHQQQYGWNMNFAKYGMWIRMTKVTPMTNWYDPKQNIDRFSTGYAVPAFLLFKKLYGESDAATLRRVAFHWNKGVYKTYDRNNTDYLGLYDKYVGQFKPAVEKDDGVWNGKPYIP